MNSKQNAIILVFLAALGTASVSAQEALVSDIEQYYDFLALQGLTKRPYLNYRTLSDSAWAIEEGADHPWQGKNLGTKRKLHDAVYLKIFGPELFNSINTAAPYGQNDGALWQGRGYNASLSGGARLEAYGVELTFKPQLSFSQNAGFDLIASAYSGSAYENKAEGYGYYGIRNIDAPQRFGDDPFFTFDFGDSEIRYTWKTFTMGFGTEAIWLGPSHINSILHSNNAPTYPKFDIGLRRQPVTIPWINWYAGDIELRLWVGSLSESDYFDNNSSNDHNLITAFSVAYAPSFLPGLTLFANRNFLTKRTIKNLKYIGYLFWVTLNNEDQIQKEEDQRASLGASWLLPRAGIEVYGELGINDYSTKELIVPGLYHALAYTVGVRKSVIISPVKNVSGELLLELSRLDMSLQDYQFSPASFYAHHLITQGYTNKGQWLGAGVGNGGTSQYLGFKVYYPKGNGVLFINRYSLNNDYVYMKIKNGEGDGIMHKAVLAIGLESSYFISPAISLNGGFTYNLIFSPHYDIYGKQNNFNFKFGVKTYF